MDMDGEKEVLTAREARKLLRLGHNQIYAAIKRGEIPAIRIGGKLLIPRRALLRLLEGKHIQSDEFEHDYPASRK